MIFVRSYTTSIS